jgi:catechol 2,3-dioxygenase
MTTIAAERHIQAVAFKPMRLGHANLFVADLERSIAFYSDVAGVELVRREPGIRGGFHSNGNTHHDIGLIEVAAGVRHGKSGFQQVSSRRGSQPGLNHFGWEMRSEAELIAALGRATDAGLSIANCSNHQISHSAYMIDPDGNYHEFYADIVEKWRSIFNLEREDLVTEAWDWKRSAPGSGPNPNDPKDHRRVEGALFHPRRITHATLGTKRFEEVKSFFVDVAGLSVVAASDGIAMFRGPQSPTFDLLLVSTQHGVAQGLLGISLEVEDEADFAKSRKLAAENGAQILGTLDLPRKRNVLLSDPDGLAVEVYCRRSGAKPVLPKAVDSARNQYWIFTA